MTRYINADEAKKDLDERGFDFFTSEQDIDEAKRWLDEQPVQDVKPVIHAEWRDCGTLWDGNDEYQMFRCSECIVPHYRKSRYCPYCGAKMDKEVEE